MNEFEKRVIHNLKHNVNQSFVGVMFSEYGYLIEGAYESHLLSEEWKTTYEEYCNISPPQSDDFSYFELMDFLYKKYLPIYKKLNNF